MTNEEIKKKIDVGFKSKERKNMPCPSLRLECLKLACDIATKVGTFDQYIWAKKSIEDQLETYEQMFELADMNYGFVMKEKE